MATANKCDILTPRNVQGQFSKRENSVGSNALKRYMAEKAAKVARTEKGRNDLARYGNLVKRS